MSDWKPVYVVKDGNSKPPPPPASPPKRPRKKRRWGRRLLGYSFVIVVLFGSGLAIGLAEDNEAEEYFERAGVSLLSDALGGKDDGDGDIREANGFVGGGDLIQASSAKQKGQFSIPFRDFQKDWRDIALKLNWRTTKHFDCRRGCRNFSWMEMIEVFEEGKILKDKCKIGFDHEFQRQSYKHYVRLHKGMGRHTSIVFSILDDFKTIKLISIMDEDPNQYTCPDNCEGPKEAFEEWRSRPVLWE